ncbi:hypothetical protein V8C86DRAFT_1250758 [Haematococcus lacustris]
MTMVEVVVGKGRMRPLTLQQSSGIQAVRQCTWSHMTARLTTHHLLGWGLCGEGLCPSRAGLGWAGLGWAGLGWAGLVGRVGGYCLGYCSWQLLMAAAPSYLCTPAPATCNWQHASFLLASYNCSWSTTTDVAVTYQVVQLFNMHFCGSALLLPRAVFWACSSLAFCLLCQKLRLQFAVGHQACRNISSAARDMRRTPSCSFGTGTSGTRYLAEVVDKNHVQLCLAPWVEASLCAAKGRGPPYRRSV